MRALSLFLSLSLRFTQFRTECCIAVDSGEELPENDVVLTERKEAPGDVPGYGEEELG